MGFKSFKERMLFKMADSKNKPHLNGTAKPTKESPFQAAFKLLKTVQTDSQEFKNYEQLLSIKTELQKKLIDETNEKEDLRVQCNKIRSDFAEYRQEAKRKEDVLTNTFGGRYQAWKQNEHLMQSRDDEIKQITADLQAAKTNNKNQQDQLTTLRNELKSAKSKEGNLISEVQKMGIQLKRLNAKIEQCQTDREEFGNKLQQAQVDLGEGVLDAISSEDLGGLSREFADLSNGFHRFVIGFFSNSVATKSPQTHLKVVGNFSERLNVLLSTPPSKNAMLMRCAAASAIITEVTIRYIFRSFYVSESIGDAAEILVDLFNHDKQRQNIYRCQLLKLLEDGLDTNDAISRAASEIDSALGVWVQEEERGKFRTQLLELLTAALKLWHPRIQYSRDLVLALKPTDMDTGLACHEEYGARSLSKGAKRSIIATLFPRILVEGSDYTLHPGVVLWDDQPAFLTAKDELEQHLSTTTSVHNRQSISRRLSTHRPAVPMTQRAH